MFELITTLGEVTLRLYQGLGVWRYFFSKAFRLKVHDRWAVSSRWAIASEVAFGILGFALTALVLYGISSMF